MTLHHALAAAGLASLLAVLPLAAAAQTAGPASTPPGGAPPASAPVRPTFNNNGPVSVTDTHLLSQQDLVAINSGNTITANAVGSGAITLSGSALSSFSGIGNFVMNTGHNNNLQGSVSVIINVTP